MALTLPPLLGVSSAYYVFSVVYMCAQSMFKLHPRFDAAVKGVLEASASNHVVFTAGRRPQWTMDFKRRLGLALGDVLMQKVIVICSVVCGEESFVYGISSIVVVLPVVVVAAPVVAVVVVVSVVVVAVLVMLLSGRG